MTKREVTIEYEGQSYKLVVPEEVPSIKISFWEELWKLEKELEAYPKTVTSSCGRTLTVPSRGYDLAVQSLDIPDEEKKQLIDVRNKKSSLLQKIMIHRLKVYGHAKKEKRNKFLEENGTKMLELAGREYTSAEIHRILLKEGGCIEYSEVLTFIKRNDDKIRELRNKFREDYTDLSLTVKRSRLEKLNMILNSLLTEFDNSRSSSTKVILSKEIRGILEQARKEVEGDELKLTFSGRIDIDATINSYVTDAKLLEGLTIQQIVISRVAVRLNISSQFLLDRLAKGWYSKFNGFRKNTDITTKPLYPTSVKYDILDLEEKNKKYLKKKDELINDTPFQEVRKEIKKDKLKQLLLQSRREIDEIENNL